MENSLKEQKDALAEVEKAECLLAHGKATLDELQIALIALAQAVRKIIKDGR